MQLGKSNKFHWIPSLKTAPARLREMDNGVVMDRGVIKVTCLVWLWYALAFKQVKK